jgi:hypothetical protein
MRELNEKIKAIPIPPRMKRLAISEQGWIVPWFVAWFDEGKPTEPGRGVPDFRVVDTPKIGIAIKQRRCWVCGDSLGVHLAFVLGPMCAINRTISEPPSHRDCAIFSAASCPFLTQPRMRRNEKDLYEESKSAAGFGLKRNPGCACVWITRTYRPFRPQAGQPGILFEIGPPEEVLWFARGRTATREEVWESIESGLPSLRELAEGEGAAALAELARQTEAVMGLLPADVAVA